MAKAALDRKLDVRPDRLDLRDREYQPPLVSLPEEYPSAEIQATLLPRYRDMVLDQFNEGACTGFGLACVINFLQWSRPFRQRALLKLDFPPPEPIAKVSPRMLYHLARFYDEWPGEDYEGSSCRGAMKGWHRHGVCAEKFWPYADRQGKFVPPREGWQLDAAKRILGAYYRINRASVSDMQAAVYETGAIYVSAQVHAGWAVPTSVSTLPVIRPSTQDPGGHAFAIIGYTPRGFIVQNSWGQDWGFHGFAILPYPDWIQNGMDAWVAALGVPAGVAWDSRGASAEPRASDAFRGTAFGVEDRNGPAGKWFFGGGQQAVSHKYKNPSVAPWTDERAYHHLLVMGNNGQPLNRLVTCENAQAAVAEVCQTRVRQWLAGGARPKLAIYAHGGLNSEEDAVQRTRILAPYFFENGVYPLFIAWRTGFLETLGQIFKDNLPDVSGLLGEAAGGLSNDLGGLSRGLGEHLADARDRTIELAAERLMKPVWSQMKQNAQAATSAGQGLGLLAGHLKRLAADHAGLEIHLIGHSAGSILHGNLLDLVRRAKVPVASCTLFAPACTVSFAQEHYGKAITGGTLAPNGLFVENLSEEREQADSVGPYGKSLLYLVSRALEEFHKMPLLGKTLEWTETDSGRRNQLFGAAGAADVAAWQTFVRDQQLNAPTLCRTATVSDGLGRIPSAHGSFDNDVAVITRTIERAKGAKAKPAVECLRGF